MKFAALGFSPEILKALEKCGYQQLTPVQEQAMVPARRGKDLMVNAQTGTGKTAAFALPMLQRMLDAPNTHAQGNPTALILTPTRELAEQLAMTIGEYAQFLDFKLIALYGGVKISGQAAKLKQGIDIVISTPGRMLEHIKDNNVSLTHVDYVVLDEADRMLDMGFITDVTAIMEHTAKQRQTLLFSATTTPAMNELSHKILNRHQEIRVDKRNTTADTVEHVMYPVIEERKIDLFMDLLEQYNWYQILVFTSTKRQADDLLATLKQNKIQAALCHGDKSQGARRRALVDFKSAKIQVLVATEVAARGLDIQGLDFVLNYNLPYLPEDYVHRIGRTGRAGQSGHAISFVSREEERAVARIEKVIGGKIKRIRRRGYEVSDREMLIAKNAQTHQTKKAKNSSRKTNNANNTNNTSNARPSRKSKDSKLVGKKFKLKTSGKKKR
ncbi:MAG: DEAD/DEAH box helicase [Proteobacteria bacterium]|nr:DEAD/DEAH box helicase [Pseudomonadota bacterium]